jgi:hypothetical protein
MASKRVPENQVLMSTGAAQASPVRKPSSSRRTTRTKPARTVETPAAEPATAMPMAVAAVEPMVELSPEAVAVLAYSYWEARGTTGGSPEDDWLRAEQELRVMSATA